MNKELLNALKVIHAAPSELPAMKIDGVKLAIDYHENALIRWSDNENHKRKLAAYKTILEYIDKTRKG